MHGVVFVVGDILMMMMHLLPVANLVDSVKKVRHNIIIQHTSINVESHVLPLSLLRNLEGSLYMCYHFCCFAT